MSRDLQLPSTPTHPWSIRLVTSTYWLYWLLEDQKKKGEREEKRREKKSAIIARGTCATCVSRRTRVTKKMRVSLRVVVVGDTVLSHRQAVILSQPDGVL